MKEYTQEITGVIMDNKRYGEYVKMREKRSPCLKNCFNAFITGGIICLSGELISFGYEKLGAKAENAPLYVLLTLILISGIFTGMGFYDKIAKFGGGGALVPITGFANAMAASATESRTEGLVNGTAVNLYKIAGPVIVFGTSASVLYGVIYYFFG